ncbi:glycosyl transferase, group 1 [candidate division TM7 genomosp. GTL1]|nr:glycosyl transferase, group 1 [candidate division TM7 genomosp. GTL1]
MSWFDSIVNRHHYREWIVFKKSDTVLMLGKPWDNPDIQATLTAERKRVHFQLAQVVYDLIICLYPHLHHPSLVEPYTKYMIEAIKHSDLLLPISKSSKRDLIKFAKLHSISAPKTKVIRLGDTLAGRGKDEKPKKPDERIGKNFILCVGTVEIRKNHTLLYYTYKLAAEKGIELPQLVVVGTPGWLSGDTQHLIATDPAIKDKIIMLHSVEDAGLTWVYEHCLFTIYPSMYEGWGLPIAESLAYGKACLASRASSMPEVGGNLIDYFSPYDPGECLKKIASYTDADLRKKKEKAIRADYTLTSWEDTFRQVLGYIRER